METLFFYGHKEVLLRQLARGLKCGKGDDHMMGLYPEHSDLVRFGNPTWRSTPHCLASCGAI